MLTINRIIIVSVGDSERKSSVGGCMLYGVLFVQGHRNLLLVASSEHTCAIVGVRVEEEMSSHHFLRWWVAEEDFVHGIKTIDWYQYLPTTVDNEEI